MDSLHSGMCICSSPDRGNHECSRGQLFCPLWDLSALRKERILGEMCYFSHFSDPTRGTHGGSLETSTPVDLGSVQRPCFCLAKLNSAIKVCKSMAEARRLNRNLN